MQTELAYLSTHRSQLLEEHVDKAALKKKREAVQLEEEKVMDLFLFYVV